MESRLTDMPEGVFAEMAEDLGSLGDGMQAALQNEIRAERMKTELITNVSHDLKTPLTSILSYSDLLCQMELTPEEANDYAKIIHQKGLRLKNLTSDLFDISKVRSGVEQMNCERLDAAGARGAGEGHSGERPCAQGDAARKGASHPGGRPQDEPRSRKPHRQLRQVFAARYARLYLACGVRWAGCA